VYESRPENAKSYGHGRTGHTGDRAPSETTKTHAGKAFHGYTVALSENTTSSRIHDNLQAFLQLLEFRIIRNAGLSWIQADIA
jgi:hypothetical protein